MTITTTDEFLAHYGIPGMKWGKRKSTITSAERPASEDHRRVSKLRAKKPSEMSNDELKTLTTRMNLEQQYSRLNPSKASKGKAYVAATLGLAGMAIGAYNMGNSPAAKAAIKLGKNAVYNANYAMGIIPRAIGS